MKEDRFTEKARITFKKMIGENGAGEVEANPVFIRLRNNQVSILATALREEAARGDRLREALSNIQIKINEQSEDEGLWSRPAFGTQRIAEAYLQQELRALHTVIEKALAACDGRDDEKAR